ncbi:MAG: hypothetical protein RLZZ367_1068 [Bacteroidota bacterium]|jgi:pimeloyl-ACP methyl ester carboxylesterase
MESKYIQANGIKLHYVDGGSGQLVVLLHGFPEFWYGWHKQIPVLAQHCHVVAPDMRGYNLSEKPPRVADYKIDILAADVAALIKALGYQKAIVVGHDWGAAVAWAVAALHPDVVEKLAILNVPHPAEMKRALMGGNLSQLKKSWYIFFFQLPFIPESIIGTEKFFKGTFKKMCRTKYAVSKDDIQKYVEAYSRPGAVKGPVSYYRAMFRGALSTPGLPKIKAPVMMLWGEQDTALGKELTYNTKQYCDSTFEIHYEPASGHFVQHDNPEWVNAHLVRFIQQTTS